MRLSITFAVLVAAGSIFGADDAPAPGPVTLEQIVPREGINLVWRDSVMSAGRDGNVYIAGHGILKDTAFVLRLTVDGKARFGKSITYMCTGVAANSAGKMASSHAHFAHKVVTYDQNLNEVGAAKDFLVSDKVSWDAPCWVAAGESGDFFGVDQHRDRIERIDPSGQLVKTYSILPDLTDKNGRMRSIRVIDKKETFYILSTNGVLRCVSFDNKDKWKHAGVPPAFDIDGEGNVYWLTNDKEIVKRLSPDGEALSDLTLQMKSHKPEKGKPWFNYLCVSGKNLLLKAPSESELFQCYDLNTGEFKHSVNINMDRLSVTFPSAVWTAGQATPFDLHFEACGEPVKPRWRVWARPYEAMGYRELKLANGKLDVPADMAGLYRIKVSPESSPYEAGPAPNGVSEYLVQAVVEIRPAGAKGSVSVSTTGDRVHFMQGEPIPFSVLARGKAASATVRLISAGDDTELDTQAPVTSLAEIKLALQPDVAAPELVPANVTAMLKPGRYALTANVDGMATAPQQLVIGAEYHEPAFQYVRYGDYGMNTNLGTPWLSTPDAVRSHCEEQQRSGLNLLVDRLGWEAVPNNLLAWENKEGQQVDALSKRLLADPDAVGAEKAKLQPPMAQMLSGYAAYGLLYMPILMANDAGLPLGSGYDNRKPEKLIETLTKLTRTLKSFVAVRGWVWSSNWWVFGARGAKAAKTPEEIKACEAAQKAANDTGAWDPLLDTVAGYRLGMAPEAQELFAKTVKDAAPDWKCISAVAAPYRNVESYPPITFSNVDEVDLHIQWEQMAIPYHAPHNVDFYKRPGKRGWAHPEVWNDDGTGGQFLTVLFQLIMRGADGVGFSGDITPWTATGAEDPRSAHYGYASVVRAMGRVIQAYGPLFAALQKDDRVAIAASGRMYKIDNWKSVTGLHFARQMEAYLSCLHAHNPASIVFAEDVKPDTFKAYKAVLVVDERVELEPELLAALKAAKAAGTVVFYDGTCRDTQLHDFTSLGYSFNKLENDRSPAGDDDAYWRFASYGKAGAEAISKALNAAAPPVAQTDDDQVELSQRKGEDGRYLFVVNNTVPPIDPGLLWRTTLVVTTRAPLVASVKLTAPAGVIYDVFAMRAVTPENGAISADLRDMPARLFALLPAPIEQIELKTPKAAPAGSRLTCSVQVLDKAGKAIAAPVPVRLRLIAADSSILAERVVASGSKGASQMFTAPVNAPKGNLRVEAVELFSGKSVSATIEVTAAGSATVIVSESDAKAPASVAAVEATNAVQGKDAADVEPLANSFGPHVRDVAIVDDGKLAVMNTMNWDHNIYAVDLQTGAVRWRQRAGHWYTFSPQPAGQGVAYQGFDFKSAEGYHLYMAGSDGKPERRFALYGLPVRLPHRFVPGIFHDQINNFAVPADGSWVAAAGDLGLAVWSRDGKLLWSQDWWKTQRHTATLNAPDSKTLIVVDGMKVSAYAAAGGQRIWECPIECPGQACEALSSKDGKLLAVIASVKDGGGRCFILRGGKLERTISALCETAEFSPDGSLLAVTSVHQLKLYSLADGLQWSFPTAGRIRFPRFAPDGKRVAISTDDGQVCVLDLNGAVLWQKDAGARAVPAWLPNGDLLLAGWEGAVCRLGADYKEVWRARLQPAETDMRNKMLADDTTPTVRVKNWGNAEPSPLPLDSNALAKTPTTIKFVPSGSWGGNVTLTHDAKTLIDGKRQPPDSPWIDWSYVGFFAETSPINYLLFETPSATIKLDAVTLCEDPAHPESWIRDAQLEAFDTAQNIWIPVQPLLSNAAVHSHRLAKPVEAGKFRIMLPWGVVGNLRLAQVVFHGTVTATPTPTPVKAANAPKKPGEIHQK